MDSIKSSYEIRKIARLDLGEVWYFDVDHIIQCNDVYGFEHFYPLYNWKNFYSYSPLNLLKLKGNLNYNPNIEEYLEEGEVKKYLPPNIFIDKNIRRVGGPMIYSKAKIFDEETFINEFVRALIEDIRYLEDNNKNSFFGILTGGKDSLNLLLLPWRSKIIAFSADPNYKLVKEFCAVNNLKIEVIRLEDEEIEDINWIENETLIGCCRVGLRDIRWSKNLFNINKQFKERNEKLVIITGSLADTFLTPYFKKYRCIWKSHFLSKMIYKFKSFKSIFYETSWIRGAQWQGVFHGIIRESSGLRNFSAYHGKNVLKVIRNVDLDKVVNHDLRQKIGERIFEKPVIYPLHNPSPPSWAKRQKFSSVDKFKTLLKEIYEGNSEKNIRHKKI